MTNGDDATAAAASAAAAAASVAKMGQEWSNVSKDMLKMIKTNEKDPITKVKVVPYFAGPEYEGLHEGRKLISDPRKFLAYVEAHTKGDEWTQKGRINVAVLHAVDQAYEAAMGAVGEAGDSWDEFKKHFLACYPTNRHAEVLMEELNKMTRKPGESLESFFIRLRAKARLVGEAEVAHKAAAMGLARSCLIKQLPDSFGAALDDQVRSDDGRLIDKVIKYTQSRPQWQLDSASIRKEKARGTVGNPKDALVGAVDMASSPAQVKSKKSKCATCGKAHAGVCWHKAGGSSSAAASKPTSSKGGASKSSVTCYYCNKPGHVSTECRKKKADEKNKASSTSKPALDKSIQCFLCKGYGHMRDVCANNKTQQKN